MVALAGYRISHDALNHRAALRVQLTVIASFSMRAAPLLVLLAGACHAGGSIARSPVALRPACGTPEFWDGTRCAPRGDAPGHLARSKAALDEQNVDTANQALDAAAKAGPLDHEANIALWEQRGIAASFAEDDAKARAAFEMLLALDPGHFLSYQLSTKATFRFEKVRNEAKSAGAPALDVDWAFGQKVGAPVKIDVSVLADPKQFLHKATLFVRTRGEPAWRAADVPLAKSDKDHHLVLPPIHAEKAVSLELYLKAYDERGNEVLTWAAPARPREIPLRYDPPRPWWQKWWVITIAGTVAVAGTAGIVYAVTREPPSTVDGGGMVR